MKIVQKLQFLKAEIIIQYQILKGGFLHMKKPQKQWITHYNAIYVVGLSYLPR